MADDRRQQLADDKWEQLVEVLLPALLNEPGVACAPGPLAWRLTALLLPMLDRVAADAAAEALTAIGDHLEDLAYAQRPDNGSHGGGLLAAVGEIRDRAAELRAPARTDEEN